MTQEKRNIARFRGFRLKQIRRKNGYNQKQLCDKLMFGYNMISKYETERALPNEINEKSLCSFFKVDLSYFRRDDN